MIQVKLIRHGACPGFLYLSGLASVLNGTICVDTEIIKTSWDGMAGRRLEFVQAFYDRLFERHPHYRELFPESMHAQLERMIEMMGTLAQFADRLPLLQPYHHFRLSSRTQRD